MTNDLARSTVVLSWEREDLERKLSLPAGRFTDFNPVAAALGGGVLTAGLYAALLPFQQSAIGAMFFERGWVPPVIVFCSCFCIVSLVVKWTKVRLQEKALTIPIAPESYDFVLSPTTAKDVLDKIYRSVDDPRHFVLFNRVVRCLGSLKNMGRVSDVDEVLRSQADHDESLVDNSYLLVRGTIWAIPVLGFIGTVIGLSTALGSFGDVLDSGADTSEMTTALKSVTSGLSVAFETMTVHAL